MEKDWYPIVDTRGRQGLVKASPNDPSQLDVRFDGGGVIVVPRKLVGDAPDGTYRYLEPFPDAALDSVGPKVIPVVEEQLVVGKRSVERERVRVTTNVTTRNENVDMALAHDELTVERVPVGRVVQGVSPPRQEGDTLVLPVYEEVLVTEKRLVLKEEVRVTRRHLETRHQEAVPLRREEVTVEPIAAGGRETRREEAAGTPRREERSSWQRH